MGAAQSMDMGHYNCRDYYISPHFAPTTISSSHASSLHRHESWAELEHRSRSPASMKPRFPLLKLPLELRQQILAYLLPHTKRMGQQVNPLADHARNFPAVQKRGEKGMLLPSAVVKSQSTSRNGDDREASVGNLVWLRGNIHLFSVSRQVHNECADMVYGNSTFMLFLTFSGISFRYRYLLPSGMTPNRSYSILELLPDKYLRRIRNVVVHVDHVDSYTGMIKFNVSGKGLTHGLRRQVQRLVLALQPEHRKDEGQDELVSGPTRVTVRVSNGSAITDSLNARGFGARKVSEDIAEMLEPFGCLRGVQYAKIMGAVGDDVAQRLEERMQSTGHDGAPACCCSGSMADAAVDEKSVQLCVYGNDI